MNFEQTLAAILGFVGREVTAHVFAGSVPLTTESGGAAVVRLVGILRRAEGRAERLSLDYEFDEDSSNLFFTVGEGEDGFFLNPTLFRSALMLNPDLLTIEMPGVYLHVTSGRWTPL